MSVSDTMSPVVVDRSGVNGALAPSTRARRHTIRQPPSWLVKDARYGQRRLARRAALRGIANRHNRTRFGRFMEPFRVPRSVRGLEASVVNVEGGIRVQTCSRPCDGLGCRVPRQPYGRRYGGGFTSRPGRRGLHAFPVRATGRLCREPVLGEGRGGRRSGQRGLENSVHRLWKTLWTSCATRRRSLWTSSG